MRIALAGNPNSGKTTMYNRLTGASEKVGNWAGVTVDKKERTVKKLYTEGKSVVAIDLPGAYSMSAFTSEESVTSTYVKEGNPDVLINIVDATNLARSLFFTTQLLELGIPMVVALNKTDMSQKQLTKIDTTLLSQKLGCPVVETVSTAKRGLKKLMEAALSLAGKTQTAPYTSTVSNPEDKEQILADDKLRYAFVNQIAEEVTTEPKQVEKTFSDKIDAILVNRWLGIPIFALVMFLVFQISQVWVGAPIADLFVGWLESIQGAVAEFFADANPLLTSLLIDGVLGGVIAVVGFLPLVMIMYFLIALLEDCGYMSRVAVVLDPFFKRVGLSGRSVIPFVMAVGCAVPGVMASRTIRDERERRATAMLSPFMPCGAKIPVIALIAGSFFDGAGWVSTLMYLLGIGLIFVGALMVNSVTSYKAQKSFFILEMPDYKAPSWREAFQSMCARGWSYVVKAATIILLCNTAVQVMQSFTFGFALAETPSASILAYVAKPFAYLLFPILGVLSWQFAAATVTGFIAKENVVGTLTVCLGALSFADVGISAIGGLCFLLFNMFSPPCFAAIGAMRAEIKHKGWFFGAIGLQLGLGYTVAYLVYTIGTMLTAPQNLHIGFMLLGLGIVALFAASVTVLALRSRTKSNKI